MQPHIYTPVKQEMVEGIREQLKKLNVNTDTTVFGFIYIFFGVANRIYFFMRIISVRLKVSSFPNV